MDSAQPGRRDGTDIRIYSERRFEQKLRRENRRRDPLSIEVPACRAMLAADLMRDQMLDLLDGLNLGRTCRQVAMLRLDGYTVREVASLLGLSRQAVERHSSKLTRLFGPNLATAEARMVPGRVPWYGWQEVLLESLFGRRR
jgi:DNA-binding transcriptional ArsR family regulator